MGRKSPIFVLCFIFLSICGIINLAIEREKMKYLVSIVALCMIAESASALPVLKPATGRGRASMVAPVMAAPRTQDTNNVSSAPVTENTTVAVEPALAVKPDVMQPADKLDSREKEKQACLANNIGIGDTFVWASRYSNTDNYAFMIEDVDVPENNNCFVKVDLRSADPKIDVSDIKSKYYEWGTNITCGKWVDEATLTQRILDAKKSARTWATVGGAVGGATIGVGAMELFGNRLIGGKVEGQKHFERKNNMSALLKSQLGVLKKKNNAAYNEYMKELKLLKAECQKPEWGQRTNKPQLCIDHEDLFDLAEK